VGGAAIKAADGGGWSASDAFAMWREWRHLASTLARLVGPRNPRRVVATMTGEIADCFPSRAAGVAHIVGAVVEAAEACGCRAQGIYLTDGRIVTPAEACAKPLAAAASNWHAVARLAAARVAAGPALLVDIGSTTTDVVPIADGAVTPLARDDAGRMMSGELVYTGVERTPVAAIVRSLPWPSTGTGRRPIASERYADSRDAWLLLGGIPESPEDHDTADGQPATRAAAARRQSGRSRAKKSSTASPVMRRKSRASPGR
jgi:probable H4MPT-linked C1 transfer pathway protein